MTETSLKLDKSKRTAMAKLHKLLPKPKHHRGVLCKLRRGLWKLRKAFGKKCDHGRHQSLNQIELYDKTNLDGSHSHSQSSDVAHDHKEALAITKYRQHPRPHFPVKKMKEIRAVLKEIRAINLKLKDFEAGFISEEGIKVSCLVLLEDETNHRSACGKAIFPIRSETDPACQHRKGNGISIKRPLQVSGSDTVPRL